MPVSHSATGTMHGADHTALVGSGDLPPWPMREAPARRKTRHQVQEKLPVYLGFFEFVHNLRKRGKALLGALMELLVTYDPGVQYEPIMKRLFQGCRIGRAPVGPDTSGPWVGYPARHGGYLWTMS